MQTNVYRLLHRLSKPSQVASALDWQKINGSTLLSLNIHRNRIGMAVASHPSLGFPCEELEPMRFADDHMSVDRGCLARFHNICEAYKVCGIVVSWPIQKDTKRLGAACGRVVYALEEIINKSQMDDEKATTMVSSDRPLCLWDSAHIIPDQKRDPFGRDVAYSVASEKKEHRASEEQYHEDEKTMVLRVWEDFCREHWPDIINTQGVNDPFSSSTKEDSVSLNSMNHAQSHAGSGRRRNLIQR